MEEKLKDILIEIVGDSLMNGKIILKLLFLEYSQINISNSNSFLNKCIRDGILRINPDVDVISSIMTDNEYCITIEYLREYK